MNTEDSRFTRWWDAKFDPDETGRGRMLAHHGFLGGLAHYQTEKTYRIVSSTDAKQFELEVSELLSAGYEPIGELKVDRKQVPDLSHGGWWWETLYTREFQKPCLAS